MGYNRISVNARFTQPENCPVRILDCGIYRDGITGKQTLQMELANESGRTIAALCVFVVCYDRAGRRLSGQEHLYSFCRRSRGGYRVNQGADGIVLPDAPIARLSVQVRRVFAFLRGDRGEIVEIDGSVKQQR